MSPKEKILDLTSSSSFFVEEDYDRAVHNFLVIQRMIMRFLKTGNINEKLLINNIIISINTFGSRKVNEILKVILSDAEFSVAKSILVFLKAYHHSKVDKTKSNRIIDDILRDTKQRYNLC